MMKYNLYVYILPQTRCRRRTASLEKHTRVLSLWQTLCRAHPWPHSWLSSSCLSVSHSQWLDPPEPPLDNRTNNYCNSPHTNSCRRRSWIRVWCESLPWKKSIHLAAYNLQLLYFIFLFSYLCIIVVKADHESSLGTAISSLAKWTVYYEFLFVC